MNNCTTTIGTFRVETSAEVIAQIIKQTYHKSCSAGKSLDVARLAAAGTWAPLSPCARWTRCARRYSRLRLPGWTAMSRAGRI